MMGDSQTFTEGMRAYRQGDYALAAETLVALDGRDDLMGRLAQYYCAMAHRAIGIEDIQSGRMDAAIWHLRQAVSRVGNKADLVEYLLAAYAKTGQYERCAGEADVLTELNRQDVAARVRLAQAQWRSGRGPLAIMTLTAALRELGDHADLHLHLGLFCAAGGQYDLGATHLERAVECDCTAVGAFRYLGLAYSALGQFHKAAGAFARALTMAPQDALLAFHLCQAADAARLVGRPITLAIPENARAVSSSQIRQLAEYAAGEPDFIAAFLALPDSAADAELFGVIVAVLRTALASHPGYADLHYFASVALARLAEDDSAVAHARRAVEINPRYAKALVHLAELEGRRGDDVAAAEHLRQAIAAGADWADVHARLADLLRQRGLKDDSARHYRRALELNNRFQRARAGLNALAA